MDSVFKLKLIDYYIANLENLMGNYPRAQELIQIGLRFNINNRKDSILRLRFIKLNATVFSNLDDQKRSIEQGLNALEFCKEVKG